MTARFAGSEFHLNVGVNDSVVVLTRLPGQPLDPRNRITPPGHQAPASPSQDRGCREPIYLTTVSWRCRGSGAVLG